MRQPDQDISAAISAETAAAVLIVDDYPANLVALEAVLAPLGHRVVRASSGEQALGLSSGQNFACILLDVQMPGLDGYETARLIRQQERGSRVPILFLTAINREKAHIERGYATGAVDYLVKPYDPDILRAKVRVFVDLHRREQRIRDRERLHQADAERARGEALSERQKLDDIFLQAPVAICIMEGADHTFTFANPSYLALVGGRSVVGKPLLEALPELRGQGFDRLLDGVISTGKPYVGREVELKLGNHGTDEPTYMNFVYQPKRNGAGQVDGVLVCAFEVTDHVLARRRSEAAAEALRLADERSRLAIRSSGLTIFEQDLALRHVWIHNPVAGFSPESIVGKTDRELHPAENADRLEPLKRRALAGELVREEVALRFGDELRFFHLTTEPHRDSSGAIDGLIGTTLEVTEQVRSREEAEKMATRLRDSEERFRTLADSIPQLAWIAEANGDIYWYNQRWYDYTGTTFEQMKGWGWQAVHDAQELPRVVTRFQAALASGELWEDTFPLRGADGQFRWFLSRALPVRDAAGRIIRWFGTNTNVDEDRRQAAALKEAVAMRDDFLSIAGHELKTPLAALVMHLQSVQRARRANATPLKLDERLEKAADAGLRLEKLINQMLDVSRITAGQLRLDPEAFLLDDLVREVADRFAEQAERAGTSITVRCADRVTGCWDRLRLDQVVTNLIGNALKYGRGKPIEVDLMVESSEAVLRVIDQGIGIDPTQQHRIFERFERAVGTREFGGLGLGLWIARQIVEASGGRIQVESTPHQGSVFSVRLPLRLQERPTPTAAGPAT